MYWKFDFSPDTSDIFAVDGAVDVAVMDVVRVLLEDVVEVGVGDFRGSAGSDAGQNAQL